MSLSAKSDKEISRLLTLYGIAHGPVVGSTRKTYEKKLEKAMQNSPVKNSDKTYYREEVEEITYITYHTPQGDVVHGDVVKRRTTSHPDEDKDSEQDAKRPGQKSGKAANHSVAAAKEWVRKTITSRWKVIWVLLLLAVLTAVCYYTYPQGTIEKISETNETSEINEISEISEISEESSVIQ